MGYGMRGMQERVQGLGGSYIRATTAGHRRGIAVTCVRIDSSGLAAGGWFGISRNGIGKAA